jgi:phosphoesterase RecJ-like protein
MTATPPPPTTDDYRAAAQLVLSWDKPLLLTHERPDGDALGCLLALADTLRRQGRQPVAALYAPAPARYAFLDGLDNLQVIATADDPGLAGVDGVVVMDTCARGQLTPVADWLAAGSVPVVALDHHRTRDLPATRYLIDPESAAAALLLHDWIRSAGWELSTAACTGLFVGIATDTGWFRYSNTSAACLRAAADLVGRGVDIDHLHQALYQSDSIAMIRARAVAQSGLTLHADDALAITSVSRAMLAEVGATPADLEDVVNLPMSAARVRVSAILVETGDGVIKCSFRGKGEVDVAALAAGFGGGGHARAAGARISGTLSEVRKQVVAAVTTALSHSQ